MADHSERIAEIQDILRTGAKRVNVDGQSMEYDFAALRQELRELMADDNTNAGRKPPVMRADLSGF